MVRLTSDAEGSEVKTSQRLCLTLTSPVFTWTFSSQSKIILHFAPGGFTHIEYWDVPLVPVSFC